MKQLPVKLLKKLKNVLLFLVILFVMAENTVLIVNAYPPILPSRLQVATPYPTDYPPALQTIEAIRRQDLQSAALTPLPTGTLWSFGGGHSYTEVPQPPPPSTPAG